MNVDMITTFLNDFSTFWKNIWEFLKPIFNMAGTTWNKKDENGEIDHLGNLNKLAQSFGEIKKGEGEEAELAGYTKVEEPAGSSK